MKYQVLVSFLFVLGCFHEAPGQAFERVARPFFQAGQPLENALAGGLNSPQLSAVDLNNDGLQDLFVFDRVGFTVRCFLNRGASGRPDYIWAPAYEQRFPAELRQWVLLRDFNQDGVMDIFAYSDFPGVDGVIVYRGYYEADGIHFQRMNFPNRFNILTYNFNNSLQVYITGIDYPSVDDIDCDGDLDILTFNAISPGRLEWYKNEALERNLGLDTMIFRLQDRCWGGFYESGISPAVDLAAAPGDCFRNLQQPDPQVSVRHAGSTVLTLDIDQDDDKDVIIGDLSFSKINRLINGGGCDLAWMNEQDAEFPSYDTPVELTYFPASFYLDINNDGREDLLVAPNSDREVESKDCLWWYENIGEDGLPDFTLRQKNFLVNTMVDLGERTHPAVVDYNADGLPDLVVGSAGSFDGQGRRRASLYLFENTGTATEPAFSLVDEDYLSMRQFSGNTYGFAPAFGDLDGDGDLDALVGEELGRLFYAENTAGPGRPFAFGPWVYGYQNIDVGMNSAPFLYDLNEDGLLDMVIGEFDGNINFFANTGTKQSPAFSPDPQAAPNQFFLGRIDARTPGSDGYSTPAVVKVDGETRLVTGTDIGRLEAYQVTDTADPFPSIAEEWGVIRVGKGAHPALHDLDRDGLYEVVTGSARGGLEIFQTDWAADQSVPASEPVSPTPLTLYPNPVKETLQIVLPAPAAETHLSLYRLDGALLRAQSGSGQTLQLNMQRLPAGVYWLQVRSGRSVWNEKIVKR
jgi:hypothetical protein